MKRVLVTGASGFVGQSLLRRLSLDPYLEIIALYNSQKSNHLFQASNICWKKKDLLEDSVDNLFTEIDVIYHLAGYSGLGKTVIDQNKLKNLNEEISQKIASHKDISGVEHFIYVSSIAVSEGSKDELIDESNGYPISEYGFSKKRTEDILKRYSEKKYNLTILRPTALFGLHHKGSIFELAKRIKEKKFIIFGSGKNFTNFYYIDEFTDVLKQVMLNNKFYGSTYIASSEALTLNRLVETICKSLKVNNNFIKLPLFLGYFIAYIFDIFEYISRKDLPFSSRRFRAMTKSKVYKNTKLILDLNESYSQTEEGITKTVEWFLASGNIKK